MRDLTRSFIDALHQLHVGGDPAPIAALFAEGATLTKLGDHNEATGPEGARTFWGDYRAVFDTVEATFTATTDDGQRAVLEWVSEGTFRGGGHPFSYAGVSVLEGDGDQLTGFRTYYDSAVFVGDTTR